jgi:hypothetical protein
VCVLILPHILLNSFVILYYEEAFPTTCQEHVHPKKLRKHKQLLTELVCHISSHETFSAASFGADSERAYNQSDIVYCLLWKRHNATARMPCLIISPRSKRGAAALTVWQRELAEFSACLQNLQQHQVQAGEATNGVDSRRHTKIGAVRSWHSEACLQNLQRHQVHWQAEEATAGVDHRRNTIRDTKIGVVRSWRSEGTLLQQCAQPLHSTPPPMPAPTGSRQGRSISQRDLRNHQHSTSPAPLRRKSLSSSLEYELMVWKCAADKHTAKKVQLKKLAVLQQFNPGIRSIGSGPNRGHDVHVSTETIESATLLQWRMMAALALFTASITCFSYALWAM